MIYQRAYQASAAVYRAARYVFGSPAAQAGTAYVTRPGAFFSLVTSAREKETFGSFMVKGIGMWLLVLALALFLVAVAVHGVELLVRRVASEKGAPALSAGRHRRT